VIRMLLSEAARCTEARLSGEDRQFNGCSTDSRRVDRGQLFIALRGAHFDGHDFVEAAAGMGAAAALVECEPAAASLPALVVGDTRLAMGRLAANWRSRFDIPLVAVTGSNGKTTVKEMLVAILSRGCTVAATRGNLNNEIGVPLSLFGLGAEHQVAVIEMGANHPGEIAALTAMARPTVAVITQCAPAHLEGFGSVDGVAKAKAEIYAGLPADGTAIINADDAFAGAWIESTRAYRQITFALYGSADVVAENRQRLADGAFSFRLVTPRGRVEVRNALPGIHNVANALAAAACCEALDVPLEIVAAGLSAVQGAAGRLQSRRGLRGCRILDDTYNANPVSLQAGLDVLAGMPGRRWVVLGDMGELGAASRSLHCAAGAAVRDAGVERLLTIGPLSREAAAAFGDGATHFESINVLLSVLHAELDRDVALLVKGSRSMAMERVVNAIGAGD
jgi:UDP-N-acetylmuramoyl-tripeptide--D-alanyl-D-alanine ligase